MADLVMPRLSDSMEEGTVLKWLKAVGDEVAVGEELVEIETDKANMVYESDAAGVLSEILAQEGDTLPIGEVIARVGTEAGDSGDDGGAAAGAVSDRTSGGNGGGPSDGGSAPDVTKPERSEPAPATTPQPTPDSPPASAPATPADPATAPPSPSSSEPGTRVKASPIAKRIASEKGIDLAALSGSGPGGRIVKADVERRRTPGLSPVTAPGSEHQDADPEQQRPDRSRVRPRHQARRPTSRRRRARQKSSNCRSCSRPSPAACPSRRRRRLTSTCRPRST